MMCAAYCSSMLGENVTIVMSDFPIPSNAVRKGGEITTKRASYGENEVFHQGFEFNDVNHFPESTMRKLVKPTQYSRYTVDVKRGAATVKLPLYVFPGFSENRIESSVYNGVEKNTVLRTSSLGNSAVVFNSQNYSTPRTNSVQNSVYYDRYEWNPMTRVISCVTEREITYTKNGAVWYHIKDTLHFEYRPHFNIEFDFIEDPYSVLQPYVLFLQKHIFYAPRAGYSSEARYNTIELMAKATSSAQSNMSTLTDVNVANYLKELPEVLGMIGDIAKTIKNPTDPAQWASMYLSTKWGTPQTIVETEKLMRDIVRRYSNTNRYAIKIARGGTRSSYSSGYGTVSLTCNCKMRYQPNPGWAQGLVRKGMDYRLWPTFSSVYDFIPFSFVCGWFTNIPQVLESIDNNLYSEYHKILPTLYSIKEQIRVPLEGIVPGYLGPGDVQLTVYRRMMLSSAIMPYVPKLDLTAPSSTSIIDGGALIIQRF